MRLLVLSLLFLSAIHSVTPRAPYLVPVKNAQTLNFDEGRIRYESDGENSSEAILFLHGFNSQLSVWNGVWPHLEGCGRKVRIDIPGFGGSKWPADSYSLSEQTKRVIAFMDALGISKVTLVGISMGGSLSAWIAAHHPQRVKGVVLLAPSGFPGALQYSSRFATLQKNESVRTATIAMTRSPLYRLIYPHSEALQALTVTASYGDVWADALKNITSHSWVVWSRGDEGVNFSYAQNMSRMIPQSTLLPLASHVGHDILASRAELIGKISCSVHRGIPQEKILTDIKELIARNGDG